MDANSRAAKLGASSIVQMAHAYWSSQVLYVATQLDVFTKLSGKDLTLEELAGLLNIPSASLGKLLNAGCALSLL